MEQQHFKYNANIQLNSDSEEKQMEGDYEIISINHLSPVKVKYNEKNSTNQQTIVLFMDMFEEKVYYSPNGMDVRELKTSLADQIVSIIKNKKAVLKQKASAMQSQADELAIENNALSKEPQNARE